jgi:hypothetical protein
MSIVALMGCLYGSEINTTFRCAEWDPDHERGNADFVLREGAPKDWYWIKNRLFKLEYEALVAAGKFDRHVCAEPQGQWGFS